MDRFDFEDWETCVKHRDFLYSLLNEFDKEANEILDALPSTSRARRRRMFKELDFLARSYACVEQESIDVMVYARARFVEPVQVSMSYGCSYAI